MSKFELMQLASHVLIVIGSFILYRTGIHMTRVWSEMRAELSVLRGFMKNQISTGEVETRDGATSIGPGKDSSQPPSSENCALPPGS